jgi:hypothetical protein
MNSLGELTGLYGGLTVVAEKPRPAPSRAPAGARQARILGRPAAEREPAALGE